MMATHAVNEVLADTLHDQGDAVKEAIVGVSEYLCNQLDGHYPEDALHPYYKDALPRLMQAWHDYHESVVEARRRLKPAEREHIGEA
jgi:hypothetical protein